MAQMFPLYLFCPFSLQKKVQVEFVPNWLKEKVSLDFVCIMYIELKSLYLIACKRQCLTDIVTTQIRGLKVWFL